MYPKNVEYLLGELNEITTKMFSNFQKVIEETDFVEKYWRTLSQSLLSNCFVNNSRPKLISRVVYSAVIKAHPSK